MIRTRPSDIDEAATEPVADLPLFPGAKISEDARPSGSPAKPHAPESELRTEQATLPVEQSARAGDAQPYTAPIGKRFQAAALDAAAMAAVLVALMAGGALLGAPSDLSALPFYLPTWLLFSFLYHVIPLLFWGRTPGMSYAGLVARTSDGGPLAVAQAIRRWLASMSTVLLFGLPGLAALAGRSLSDRASGTTTLATL